MSDHLSGQISNSVLTILVRTRVLTPTADCAFAGLWHLKQLQAAGYGSFRVELVDEPAEQVRPVLEAYRDVMSGKRSPGAVWRWLGSLASRWGAVEGVTAGSLEVKTERPAAVLKPTAAAGR